MSVEIKVPNLPESVSDATVAKWHKKPGDTVERDETLVDLETDKVVLEVPAPADGVLESIAADEGEDVNEGQLLDRKSTRLNSSHVAISYAVFCLKKKKKADMNNTQD